MSFNWKDYCYKLINSCRNSKWNKIKEVYCFVDIFCYIVIKGYCVELDVICVIFLGIIDNWYMKLEMVMLVME